MFGVCAMQWGKPMRAGIVLSAQFCQPLTIKKKHSITVLVGQK